MRRGHSPATSVCLALVAPLRQCLRSEARREMQVESSVFVRQHLACAAEVECRALLCRTYPHTRRRSSGRQSKVAARYAAAVAPLVPCDVPHALSRLGRNGEVETVDFPFSKRKHATESEVHSKEATGGSRRGRFRWHSYHVMV